MRDLEITKLQDESKHANEELSKAVQRCLSLEQHVKGAESANQELKQENLRVR